MARKAKVKKKQPLLYPTEIHDFEESSKDYKDRRLVDLYCKNAATLLAESSLETKFLFEGAIPDQAICFFAGRPESHKSWLAYHAALSVARNESWLAFENKLDGPAPVLVMNFDNPEHELGRRFLRLGLRADDPIHFHSMAAKLPDDGLPSMLQLPTAITGIMRILDMLQPKLVVIDSYRQAHVCNEHDSSEMGRVMSCLKMMASTGCSVIALHHLRKQGTHPKAKDDDEPLRGSTEIQASADSIILCKNGFIDLYKTRSWTPKRTRCDFQVVDEGDSTVVRSPEVFDALIALLKKKGPLMRTEIRTELSLGKTANTRLITRAVEAGIVREASRKNRGAQKRISLTEDYNPDEWSDFDADAED